MKLTIIIMVLIILTGCASNGLTPDQKMAWLTAQSERKTFEIECETGCKIAYTDPRDRPTLPQETNGADVAIKALDVVGGIAPIYIGARAAVQIADRIGVNNSVSNVDNSIVDNSAVATPTVVNPEVITAPNPVIVNPEIVPTQIVQPQVVNPVVVNPEIIQTPLQ